MIRLPGFQILGFVLLYLLLVSPVYASRTLSIMGDKTTLLGDEEFTITASASGFTEGETIYIKGAFYQSGSSNYFGYTKSGDEWVKNSAGNTSQRSIKIGEWDGSLVVKSDFTDSGYKGEGDYSLKVGFYYGSATNVNWSSNALTVTINEPDPTPTNTPTPTNRPTPTLTPSPTSTLTPTPTSTPIVMRTVTPSHIISVTPISFFSTASGEFSVLGDEISATPTSVSTATKSGNILRPLLFSFICVGLGMGILSGVFVWERWIHTKDQSKTSV
ncbi:MAG TPA: hypothetical protein VMR81_07265 [Patescibacteria group bacterium]|jgi:hypothetical protein|nr:hypothetical protein [Patescibacteria group bacterium]